MELLRSIGFKNGSIESCFTKNSSEDAEFDYKDLIEYKRITYNGKAHTYALLFDVLEILSLEEEDDEQKCAYLSLKSGALYEIESIEEESGINTRYKILKFNIANAPYQMFAEFPASCVPEKIENKRYSISLAGVAITVRFFKNEDDFNDVFEDLDVRSLAPTVEYEPAVSVATHAFLHINGYVKEYEKRINPFTEEDYYKIIISSFSGDYVVFAAGEDVSSDISPDAIISVTARMLGRFDFETPISYVLTWKKDDGENRFNDEIAPILFNLRPLYDEYFVLNFDSNAIIDDTEFIQTVQKSNGNFIIEIGKQIDGKRFLYRLERVGLMDALKTFFELCVNKCPVNLSAWKDVSKEIFGDRDN